MGLSLIGIFLCLAVFDRFFFLWIFLVDFSLFFSLRLWVFIAGGALWDSVCLGIVRGNDRCACFGRGNVTMSFANDELGKGSRKGASDCL